MRLMLFVLSVGGVLSGCGGGSSSDYALPFQERRTQDLEVDLQVGPAGGRLATLNATLEVPEGGLVENQVLSMREIPLEILTPEDLAFGDTLTTSAQIQLGPKGLIFSEPVRVQISYRDALIVAPDAPSDLLGLFQDPRTGRFEYLEPVELDTARQQITFELDVACQIQVVLLARIVDAFLSCSVAPSAGLAPGDIAVLSLQLRNKLRQEFGGVELTFSASGAENTFTPNPAITDLDGRAEVRFMTTEGGVKQVEVRAQGQLVKTMDVLFGRPPVTAPDAGSTDEDSPLNGSGLLSNDSDPDMDALSAVAETVASSMGAVVTIAADGSYTYDPTSVLVFNALAQGTSATDTFTYQASDGAQTTPGTVTITVSGVNDAPLPQADTGSTDEDSLLLSAGLLSNDADPDTGDTLALVAETVTSSMGASVTINGDGTYAYDPTGSMTLQALAQGAAASDAFTYQATDGVASTPGTVTITVAGLNDAPTALADVGSTDEDTLRRPRCLRSPHRLHRHRRNQQSSGAR